MGEEKAARKGKKDEGRLWCNVFGGRNHTVDLLLVDGLGRETVISSCAGTEAGPSHSRRYIMLILAIVVLQKGPRHVRRLGEDQV